MARKIYKYNINTSSLGTVTAEIYYESSCTSDSQKFSLEISAGQKTFSNFWHSIRHYSPREIDLIDAKKWAIKQCRIMNENQPDHDI